MTHNVWNPDGLGGWNYGTDRCGCGVHFDDELQLWFYNVVTPNGLYPFNKAYSETDAMTKAVSMLKRLISDEGEL